jgi:hypothetical protein
VLWVVLLNGCAGTTPEPPIAPDRARLIVTPKAEPKQGWRDPKTDSAYTGTAQIGQGKQFETVDYESLDEIVVWVEPAIPVPQELTEITIDLARPDATLRVAPAGVVWFVKGGSAYLRTEDGRVMNLASSSRPTVHGYVEVMAESNPDPVARLYVTATRFAQVGQANQKMVFDGLPPGAAKAVAWHPRLPGGQTSVELEAGKSTSATVTVGVNSLPKAR